MNTNDLRYYTSVYGGDLARWPDDLRRQAQILLPAVPELHRVLDEARWLDERILATAPVVDDDRVSRAVDRVLAGRTVTTRHKAPRRFSLATSWLVPAATCLGALVLGLFLGLADLTDNGASAQPEQTAVRVIFGVNDPLAL